MATNIFNFNGTLLTTVADGTIDTTHSTLKFPGTGYQNYSEPVLENILWTMQNFAGATQPALPLNGQTWYDTNAGLLKIYNGSTWVAVGNVITASTTPTATVSPGTFWYDAVNLQLNVWDGAKYDLVGPLGSAVNTDPISNSTIPTFSRVEAVRLSDATTATHQAWRIVIGGTVLCIISKDSAYTPSPAITGFATIYPGINLNTSLPNIGFSGDTTIFRNNQDNLPDTNGVRSMGSSTRSFAAMYSNNGVFNNALMVNTLTTPYNFQVNGSSYLNGPLVLAAGTTSNPPLTFTSGTLSATQVLGAMEFDGSILYMTVLKNGVPNREQVGVGLQPPVGSWGFCLTGTQNAIVATSIPAQPATPIVGSTFIGVIAETNTSSTVTLQTNASSPVSVLLSDGASNPPIGSLVAGHAVLFYWNGANWLALEDLTASQIVGHPELGFLPLTGGTLTGSLILANNPTQPFQATTKQYVDAADQSLQSGINQTNANLTNLTNIVDNLNYLPLTGGTMTGFPVLPGNPTAALQATPKQYVDSSIAAIDGNLLGVIQGYLPLIGGNMSGFPSLPGNPSGNLQAAPKQYVDGVATGLQNNINTVQTNLDNSNSYFSTTINNINTNLVNDVNYLEGLINGVQSGRLIRAPVVFGGGSGTYTAPGGCSWIWVECIGGGGSGASIACNSNGGAAASGGGGGGCYVAAYFSNVGGQSINYVIGGGGGPVPCGSSGAQGGTTAFYFPNVTIAAGGGYGGQNPNGYTSYGGAGGNQASNGSIVIFGQPGGAGGNNGFPGQSGNGGAAAIYGTGGMGGFINANIYPTQGFYGGGGGGGSGNNYSAAGGNGLIRIWEFY